MIDMIDMITNVFKRGTPLFSYRILTTTHDILGSPTKKCILSILTFVFSAQPGLTVRIRGINARPVH